MKKFCFLSIVLMVVTSVKAEVIWSGDLVPENPNNWTSTTEAFVGKSSEEGASLTVNGGSAIVSGLTNIARYYISNAVATVDGPGSTWTTGDLYVGNNGYGVLNITNGGVVSSVNGDISHVGAGSDRINTVNVDGPGSEWINSGDLMVGYSSGSYCELNITNGGLVKVGDLLRIDHALNGNDFVNMTSGGMLAVYDSNWEQGDDLDDFLGLVIGNAAIQYWDGSDWAHITTATEGVDYTLTHNTTDCYTVLTVGGVPEPTMLTLLLMGLGGLLVQRRFYRKNK